MGKIWLKSPDPSHQCCGCEGKAGPCDSCVCYPNAIGFSTKARAELFLAGDDPFYFVSDCDGFMEKYFSDGNYIYNIDEITSTYCNFFSSVFMPSLNGQNPNIKLVSTIVVSGGSYTLAYAFSTTFIESITTVFAIYDCSGELFSNNVGYLSGGSYMVDLPAGSYSIWMVGFYGLVTGSNSQINMAVQIYGNNVSLLPTQVHYNDNGGGNIRCS